MDYYKGFNSSQLQQGWFYVAGVPHVHIHLYPCNESSLLSPTKATTGKVFLIVEYCCHCCGLAECFVVYKEEHRASFFDEVAEFLDAKKEKFVNLHSECNKALFSVFDYRFYCPSFRVKVSTWELREGGKNFELRRSVRNKSRCSEHSCSRREESGYKDV